MSSIVVKRKDGGTQMFFCGNVTQSNEDGSVTEIQRTDEEKEQDCYQSLINSIRREEFERVIKSIILGYLERGDKDYDNIQIILTGDAGWKTELNIGLKDPFDEKFKPKENV